MKGRTKSIIPLMLMIFILIFPQSSVTEGIQLNMLLTGEADIPLSVSISSPYFYSLAQYDEDRIASLNKLLQHISAGIRVEDQLTETGIYIDDEAVLSVYEWPEENKTRKTFSFEPEIILENGMNHEQKEESVFTGFLDTQFFRINRLMDSLYLLLEKSPSAFENLCKSEKTALSFKKFGKAVRQVIIRFSAEYVREHFPDALFALTESEECRSFLGQLHFNGSQKIILLYDTDDHIIRMNYDGTAGFSEESLRKVSINWKTLRTQDHMLDDMTIKTPAVKGYDKYNLTYSRELDLTDPDHHAVIWNFELDLKAGEVRKRIQFTTDLRVDENILKGKSQFSQKQDGKESKIIIVPALGKENAPEYEGLLEITYYSGKIVDSSFATRLRVSPGDHLSLPEYDHPCFINAQSTEGIAAEEELQSRLESILVSRLMMLPREDLDFFSKDIPDEVWNTLTQSLY